MIIIDLELNDYSSGAQGYATLTRELVTRIIRIRNEKETSSGILLSRLICSTSMFNILSDVSGFSIVNNKVSDIENGHVMMGRIFDIEIFISIDIPREIIHLTMDTDQMRDKKIDFLLGDNTWTENIVEIKVISDLL